LACCATAGVQCRRASLHGEGGTVELVARSGQEGAWWRWELFYGSRAVSPRLVCTAKAARLRWLRGRARKGRGGVGSCSTGRVQCRRASLHGEGGTVEVVAWSGQEGRGGVGMLRCGSGAGWRRATRGPRRAIAFVRSSGCGRVMASEPCESSAAPARRSGPHWRSG
jgi:hypothetical protein